nr:toxin-antitoxin system protein [Maliibacterium massiliense]
MRPLKEQVSITLDAEVIASIRKLAEEDDRSFSQYVNMVLKEHLKTKEA